VIPTPALFVNSGLASHALVRALIDSPPLRDRMGRAPRQHVGERAAVPIYAARLASMIETVVSSDVRQPA
jgi:hypothetical protein